MKLCDKWSVSRALVMHNYGHHIRQFQPLTLQLMLVKNTKPVASYQLTDWPPCNDAAHILLWDPLTSFSCCEAGRAPRRGSVRLSWHSAWCTWCCLKLLLCHRPCCQTKQFVVVVPSGSVYWLLYREKVTLPDPVLEVCNSMWVCL